LTASYGGDFSFNGSTSAPVSVTITQAATSTIASTTSNSVLHGTLATLNASVSTHSLGNAPSGTITFFAGATNLGSVPAISDFDITTGEAGAVASLQTTQLPVGSDSISATYNGDTNYSSSTSVGHVINVQADFTPSLTSNAATVSQGGAANATVNVTVENGFTGTISFGCTGLPSQAQCSFSPSSLTAAGSTNLTITTKAPVSGSLVPAHRTRYLAFWIAMGAPMAGIFLIAAPARNRRKWLGGFALLLLAAAIGCGGGGGGGGGGTGGGTPGTPKGIYSVNVNATVNGFTHSNTFMLTVQ
jgi:hypothetical protein